MWAAIVDRAGIVCAVAFSGVNRGAQWPGSRVIFSAKALMGGVGVSGDTSCCSDHDIAWRARHNLRLDHLMGAGGVSGDATHPDDIIYDIAPNPNGGTGISTSGFGHPPCLNYDPILELTCRRSSPKIQR